MAHTAKDGRKFTNRPQMVQHNARFSHALKPSDPAHEEREKSMIAEMGAMHGMSVTCPACGHTFDTGHDDHSEDRDASVQV